MCLWTSPTHPQNVETAAGTGSLSGIMLRQRISSDRQKKTESLSLCLRRLSAATTCCMTQGKSLNYPAVELMLVVMSISAMLECKGSRSELHEARCFLSSKTLAAEIFSEPLLSLGMTPMNPAKLKIQPVANKMRLQFHQAPLRIAVTQTMQNESMKKACGILAFLKIHTDFSGLQLCSLVLLPQTHPDTFQSL